MPNISGLVPGNYTICVTDANGCTSCDTTNVNGVGVEEIYTGASIIISPNPFSTSATVKIDFVNPIHDVLVFTVYDIYGKEIQSVDLSHLRGTVVDFTFNRGNNLPNGLYFYKLKDSKGILSAGKLIVQ